MDSVFGLVSVYDEVLIKVLVLRMLVLMDRHLVLMMDMIWVILMYSLMILVLETLDTHLYE